MDLYQQNQSGGAESPPQQPASKASPPSTKKRIPSSPLIKKSPNTATTQPQPPASVKPANPVVAPPPPVPTVDNSLDNQPIPKLITTNDNVHYSYATTYGAIYAQQTYSAGPPMPTAPAMHPVVQNNMNNMYPAQYPQAAMPPTIQPPTMPQFQSNPAAAYYQPPPPPSGSRNYYHGPT